jgi:hypothetical protein
MQLAVLGDPFDGLDGLSLAGDRERHARIDRTAVDEDGARAARSFVADLLRAGEGERLAQRVQKRPARRREDRDLLSVHGERDLGSAGTAQHDTTR